MARDPKRIPHLLRSLEALWYTVPDMRLGQLVAMLAGTKDPFYVEDDEFLVAVEKLLARKQ